MTAAGRLHVYDADKLTGAIRARLGRKGERFVALDGKSYEVDADMCVIADDRAVLGLGGVIGGEETGVTDATTNVFIEFGLFRSEAHGAHRAEARHHRPTRGFRFERGVDPDFVVPGLELATRDGARTLRRRAEQDHDCRQAAQGQQAVQIRSRPGRAPERARARASPTSSACSPRSASRSTARASTSRPRRRRGGLTSPAPPTWSRKWSGSRASIKCRRRR